MIVTRFAPSPTGHLHLGGVYSALIARRTAHDAGGRYLVRIEDIDQTRCKPEFTTRMLDDLAWLGLASDGLVRYQSQHMPEYQDALKRLNRMGLLYPCFCTRADIAREIQAAGGAPHGPDGPVYSGKCRQLPRAQSEARMEAGEVPAWRLDMAKACAVTGPLCFHDRRHGRVQCAPERFGDVVLGRKDSPTSYHLSVTADDALQGITLVTRGEDLLPSTDVHRVLQTVLDLPEPEYLHHRLLYGPDGKRFAKRDKSVSVPELRAAGHSAAQIIAMTEELAASR
jgi:glutamyl-Q tRNA(Asp) synthetase